MYSTGHSITCGRVQNSFYSNRYLARFDDELERLKAQVRPGRPVPVKVNEIEAAKEAERKEYEQAGIEIPDLASTDNVVALKAWDGTYHSIKLVRMIRFKKPAAIKVAMDL